MAPTITYSRAGRPGQGTRAGEGERKGAEREREGEGSGCCGHQCGQDRGQLYLHNLADNLSPDHHLKLHGVLILGGERDGVVALSEVERTYSSSLPPKDNTSTHILAIVSPTQP